MIRVNLFSLIDLCVSLFRLVPLTLRCPHTLPFGFYRQPCLFVYRFVVWCGVLAREASRVSPTVTLQVCSCSVIGGKERERYVQEAWKGKGNWVEG